ncbi:60S ribosomal protein L10 [Lemmus lemmus]
MVSDKYELCSSKAPEAAHICANKYMVKNCGEGGWLSYSREAPPLLVIQMNNLLSCPGSDWLQTGMRSALGSPRSQ